MWRVPWPREAVKAVEVGGGSAVANIVSRSGINLVLTKTDRVRDNTLHGGGAGPAGPGGDVPLQKNILVTPHCSILASHCQATAWTYQQHSFNVHQSNFTLFYFLLLGKHICGHLPMCAHIKGLD